MVDDPQVYAVANFLGRALAVFHEALKQALRRDVCGQLFNLLREHAHEIRGFFDETAREYTFAPAGGRVDAAREGGEWVESCLAWTSRAVRGGFSDLDELLDEWRALGERLQTLMSTHGALFQVHSEEFLARARERVHELFADLDIGRNPAQQQLPIASEPTRSRNREKSSTLPPKDRQYILRSYMEKERPHCSLRGLAKRLHGEGVLTMSNSTLRRDIIAIGWIGRLGNPRRAAKRDARNRGTEPEPASNDGPDEASHPEFWTSPDG